jgi:ribonucleoside-diphosphate reductase alpha chain
MRIKKRDGSLQALSFNKIIYRLKKLCNDKSLGKLTKIDPDVVAQKVVTSLYPEITSTEIDEEAARIAIGITENRDFAKLASRIIISNLHKNTIECFSEVMELLNAKHEVIKPEILKIIKENRDTLDLEIDYQRDYLFDYFGYKTLEKGYLMKTFHEEEKRMILVERPQHLYMRVALAIHLDDIPNVLKTYNLLSQHMFTFASPTMFNGATKAGNLSSCFLQTVEDSLEGIFKAYTDSAKISKIGGGIGVDVSDIRAKGSLIKGTNGMSDGLVPMLKVYNEVACFINQCFTPDTWVYSKSGPKEMKDITTNDSLVTIDGTFKKVNQVMINEVDKEILEIRATNTLFPVKVTGDHELYLLKGQKKITSYSIIKTKLKTGVIKPEFYKADELTEDDFVGFPIPVYELDNDIHDLEYYMFYGMMLGDGHLCKNRNEYGITLGNDTKSDLKEFTRNFLTKHNINYFEVENETACLTIRWSGNDSWKLSREMLYDSENQKVIVDDFLHLPKPKIMQILKGLLRTDGSNLKELAFTSSSKKLIMQIRYLMLRIGVLTSGCVKDNVGKSHVTKHGRTITTKQLSYYLRIPKHPNLSSIVEFKTAGKYFKYFEYNGMLFGRIKSIRKVNYSGKVYDFNMIDNHNYLTDMGLVHNSGRRKGSFAMYLAPWHSDILEFLDLRKNQGSENMRARDLFYAMWISDEFMKAVKNDSDWYLMCPNECPGLTTTYGDEFAELYWKYVEEGKYRTKIKAHKVWTKILESQIETGTPYMLYKDSINKKSNQKNIGIVKSSNLCVAPETKILTSTGYFPISDLENKNIDIWNGQEFTKTRVCKTGENQELLKVVLGNGSEIECTPYHKFYITTGSRPSEYPRIKQIEAKDLKKDMRLIKSEFPIIRDGLTDFPHPYTHGLFSADGTIEGKKDEIFQCKYKAIDGHNYCGFHVKTKNDLGNDFPTIYCQAIVGEGFPRITLYGEKKKMMKYIETRLEVLPENNSNTIHCRLPINMKPKFTVPINYSLDIKLRWLEGFVDGDGCVVKSGVLTCIQMVSIDKDFLNEIKYMLQTLGCDPKIKDSHKESFDRFLPDGKGGHKQYHTQQCYRLLLSSHDTASLYDLGFRPKRLQINGTHPKKNAKHWTCVTEVIRHNRISDTFCFKEEKRGMGIFNGVLTGNCAEVCLVANEQETAVCNLASIPLPKYVEYNKGKPFINFEKLHEVTQYIVHGLTNVINNNVYPTPESELSNKRNFPIGLGIQGAHEAYIKMRIPFDSEEAKALNKEIFETIYHGAITGSMELSKKFGPYETFKGSPFSQGKFQFNLAKEFDGIDLDNYLSGRYDWDLLRQDVMKYGMRNSMLLSLMPTASSSQIMNNCESFDPINSNLFKRRVLSGEYVIVNKYLVDDLTELKLWNKEMKDLIIQNDGSIQNIDSIPANIKALYKTCWEISMRNVIDQASDRQVFVDQSQSMNLFVKDPTFSKLTSMHFYAHSKNLKTGMYYLRSQAKSSNMKITNVTKDVEESVQEDEADCINCSS